MNEQEKADRQFLISSAILSAAFSVGIGMWVHAYTHNIEIAVGIGIALAAITFGAAIFVYIANQ